MTATALKLPYKRVAAAFKHLGFKTADAWPVEKMGRTFEQVPDLEDQLAEDAPDEVKADVKAIAEAVRGGGTVEVEAAEGGSEAPAKPNGKKKEGKRTTHGKPGIPVPETDDADAPEGKAEAGGETEKPADKPEKPARKARKPKEEKAKGGEDKAEDKPAPAKANRPAGVTYSNGATYVAGQVIRKHGLKAGVTQAMVDEVAAILGRKNDHQDWFNLRNSWHALRGYLGVEKHEDLPQDEAASK